MTRSVSRYAVGAIGVCILILWLSGLLGCGGPKVIPKEQVTFHIAPDASTNEERPVYIVFRKVNNKSFLTESYDHIADMVYADPQDESLLSWHVLMPGQKEKLQVVKPDKLSIGVYVLFTQPGERWKLLLEKPLEPEYSIKIKKNELDEYRKGLLW